MFILQVGLWSEGKLMINTSQVRMYSPSGRTARIYSRCITGCNCSSAIPRRFPEADKRDYKLHFDAHTRVWGIFILTLTMMGVAFTFVVLVYFIFKFQHPVVLGATSSISALLLSGITGLYLLNFAFLFSDTPATCGIRRFGLGFFNSVIFSSLLMKIVRVGRMTRLNENNIHKAFTGGPSITVMAFILIAIEVILVGEWIIIKEPDVELVFKGIESSWTG